MNTLVDISTINASITPAAVDMIHGSDPAHSVITASAPDKLHKVVDAIYNNAHFHFVSDGSWSLHDLLISIIERYAPASVWLTTYSITQLPASILAGMIQDGRIRQLNILMDYRAKDRYPAVEQLISNVSTLKLTPIHAKVMVIAGTGYNLTLVGSANWTSNKRIEVGVIDQSASTAAAHINWINKKMMDADPFK